MSKNYCMSCMYPMDGDSLICHHCNYKEKDEPPPYHLKAGTILGNKFERNTKSGDPGTKALYCQEHSVRGASGAKYLVGNSIGEGGFGIVYIGRCIESDINQDRIVAIKEYYPKSYVSRSSAVSSEIIVITKDKDNFEKGKSRLLEEARKLNELNKTEGIVDILDYVQANNTAYIVMEYLEGITLKEHLSLDLNNRFSFNEVLEMMKPLMKALKYVHSQDIIHRDISPNNIMILDPYFQKTPVHRMGGASRVRHLKLLDFGAAKSISISDPETLSVCITQGYSPIEQYSSEAYQGPWTDVYALCATMYTCITGKIPDYASQRAESDNLKKPSELGAEINSAQEGVLMRGMSVFQKDRYQNISELEQAFEKAEKPQGPHVKNLGPTQRVTEKARKKSVLMTVSAALIVLFLLMSGVISYAIRNTKNFPAPDPDSITHASAMPKDIAVTSAPATQTENITTKSTEPAAQVSTSARDSTTNPISQINTPDRNPAINDFQAEEDSEIQGNNTTTHDNQEHTASPPPQPDPTEAQPPQTDTVGTVEIETTEPSATRSEPPVTRPATPLKFSYKPVPYGIEITGYNAKDRKVTINKTINGQPVVAIADYAFYGNTDITSVNINSEIISIGASAFEGCINLERFEATSVQVIGESAFASCSKLSEVYINAMYRNYSDRVVINVQTINDRAFYGCEQFSDIYLQNNVQYIGQSAFENCRNLKKAYFSGDAPDIGINIFKNADKYFIIYYHSNQSGWRFLEWKEYPASIW